MHASETTSPTGELEIDFATILNAVTNRWKRIAVGSLCCGILAFAIASLIKPTFTARTSILPPQQQQSSAASSISQLGALAGISSLGGFKNPSEQYKAMMESALVRGKLVEQFGLMEVYEAELRQDALSELADNVKITTGKKDGLIVVEVDDHDPKRAADIANAMIEQLRTLTNSLAVSEAQQRRVFFEQQLQAVKNELAKAQLALQSSGINENAIKAEPATLAGGYLQLKSEVASIEVQIASLRQVLAENAPELKQLESRLRSMRTQVARAERQEKSGNTSDYVSKYREFKYQETLFEMFARQYEIARADESREGALIQILDVATPPERKSKPKRGLIALFATALGGLLFTALIAYQAQSKRS